MITHSDKGKISRMIEALELSGFLVCINPGDKVKFYESTSKKFSSRNVKNVTTIGQEKKYRLPYRGYETRVHGIQFRATILSWKKRVYWHDVWTTKGTTHYMVRKKGMNVTFIRHKSAERDTLRLIIPDVLWDVRQKGSVTQATKHKARLLMGEFATKYGIRLKGFSECPGTSYAIPVRNKELVEVAQEKTVYFDNGAMIDASHGMPEFEAPLSVMQELLSLPARVTKLEKDVKELRCAVMNIAIMLKETKDSMDELKTSVKELKDMFSPSKRPDDFRDVT